VSLGLSKLPGLGRVRRSGRLNALLRLGHGDLWGRFSTRDEAAAFLRPQHRVTYDDPQIAEINVDHFSRVHSFDWPVLFFLQQALSEGRLTRLTDFGGHLGVKYDAYRSLLDFPAGFTWQVVDVPTICVHGRQRLQAEPAPLAFHERIEDAPCDVLLCSGALQYADKTPEEVAGKLPYRPSMILLNKLPIASASGYYTLENFGRGRMPYRVFSKAELDASRERLGYTDVAEWIAPHPHEVVHHQTGHDRIQMIGQAWRLP
jgi:putative methyltransferase (TIGR04325 family)